MNKNRLLNSIFVFFMLAGVYHLQACTVLNDASTGEQTQTSTTGQNTSLDLTSSTTANESSTGVSTGEVFVCGDCIKSSSEECDFCEYKSENQFSFCSDKNWPLGSDKGVCEIAYNVLPQMDCSEWSCNQSTADLYCKILTKSLKAKAPEFIVGEYAIARGLWSPQLVSKNGVELTSISDEIYPTVFYYDENPYQQSIKTLVVKNDFCLTE